MPSSSSRTFSFLPWTLLALLVAGVHLSFVLVDPAMVAERSLADGDAFLRLVRVRLLHDGSGWYDDFLPMLDAPMGTTSHWTRLLDVLILLPSLALEPFLGFEEALYWTGALISPALHVLTALALAWAARPLLGREGGLLAGALTLAQMGITGYGGFGHADHHVLFLLLEALALGVLWRGLDDPGARLAPAGFLMAVAVWVGVEALAFTGVAFGVGGLVWVAGEDSAARRNRALARGFFWGLAVCLAIERAPSDWLSVEYDRLSAVHLTLAGLMMIFWMGAARLPEPRAFAGRVLFAAGGAIAIVAVLRLAFPGILGGPMAGIDPASQAFFFANVLEFQRMKDPGMFLAMLGGALAAVPWTALRLRREWRGEDRWSWLLLGLGLVFFVPMATGWLRWTGHAGLFIAVGLGGLVRRIDEACDAGLAVPVARALAKVVAVAALVALPLAVGSAWHEEKPQTAADRPDCRFSRLAPLLEAPPWSEGSRIILASANLGPEIAYRTGHEAVASLYHRSAGAIRDFLTLFRDGDPETVRALIERREIDLILICPGQEEGLMGGPESLYRRLVENRPPAWAREVPLPKGPGLDFRMFKVVSKRP